MNGERLADGEPAKPIVVLISGRGSNLRALIECSRRPASSFCVALVLSERDAAGLRSAEQLGIPTRRLRADPGTDRAVLDAALGAAIEECSPALIVLAGFMRILSAAFVERYAGRILNIHPSLLPVHPGLHTHRRVLAARESVHGATVHFVDARLDGGPRVIQARVPVRPDDDEETLAARVLSMEHRIYSLAVDWYCRGRLRCVDGEAWLDGRPLAEPLQYDAACGARPRGAG